MDPVWVVFPRLLEPYGWRFPRCTEKCVVHEVLQRGRLPLGRGCQRGDDVVRVGLVVAVLLRGRGTGAGLNLQEVRLSAAAGCGADFH